MPRIHHFAPLLAALTALLTAGAYPAAAACSAFPAESCSAPGKSRVSVREASRNKLAWGWKKGPAIEAADVGDPTNLDGYSVCVYAGAHSTLIVDGSAPPDPEHWRVLRNGIRYANRDNPDGIRRIRVKTGEEGKAKISVKGVDVALADGLAAGAPLRVQLVNTRNNQCWEDTYGGQEIRRADATRFKGRGAPEDPGAPLPVLRTPAPLPALSAADAGVPAFSGSPAVANAIPPIAIPLHPFLDNDGDARIHNDVYNSAVYNRPGPLGVGPEVSSIELLPDVQVPLTHVCATLAFTRNGEVIGSCIQSTLLPEAGASTQLIMLDPDTLDVLAEVEAAPRPLIRNSAGGAYFSLDQQDRIVIGPANNHVETWAVEVLGGTAYFVRRHFFDVSGDLPQDALLQDTAVDWQGRFWFLAIDGEIGYVDPATGVVRVFDMGEGLQNSMALDATGVYVVTFEALHKYSVGGDGSIVQDWRVAYDAGTQQLESPGSGTTPTLFGTQDDLIGICDNAETRVNLFIRDRTTGAEVCTVPLFRPDESACENTLVGYGDDAVIVNNAGYLGALEVQNVVRPGIEKHRVRANRSGCDPVWVNDAGIGNSAQLSTTTGLVYGWGADPNEPTLDAYYFTANSWDTGDEVYRIYVGNDQPFNTANGQPHLHPDGTAFVGSLQGIIRVGDGTP